MQKEQLQSHEGERKLGDPGFIRIHVEHINYDKRVTWTHPKGICRTTKDLQETEHERHYGGLAKWYNTNYHPDTVGEGIGGYTLEELAAHIRQKQEETGVTDPKKYTFSFDVIEENTPVSSKDREGTSHQHALSQDEQQQLLALLKDDSAAKSLGGAFENLGKNLDGIVSSFREKMRSWFGEGE